MKTTIILPLLLLASFSSTNTFAADDDKEESVNYSLGLNAGWVVGNGILYRYYSGKRFYQATFIGLIDKESEEEYLNFSISYALYLNKFDYGTPIGLKWVIGGEGVYDQYQETSNNQINIGSGIGIDIGRVSKQGVIISMDLIYTATFDGIRNPEFSALALKPSLGIAYNF